jgi:hypothetical protein
MVTKVAASSCASAPGAGGRMLTNEDLIAGIMAAVGARA